MRTIPKPLFFLLCSFILGSFSLGFLTSLSLGLFSESEGMAIEFPFDVWDLNHRP